MSEELKRLNKYLSEAGHCSRREADRLIDAGRVTINDVVPEMGTKVSSEDVIKVDGEVIGKRRNGVPGPDRSPGKNPGQPGGNRGDRAANGDVERCGGSYYCCP